MPRISFILIFTAQALFSYSQVKNLELFLSDTSLNHATVSLCFADALSGEIILGHNSEKSLIPASVMKLITTASAIELLGPDYRFRTVLGYNGKLNKRSGKLKGDVIIKGGGDPALGSRYFTDHYRDFMSVWVNDLRNLGIKKIKGRIISDDSYYDFQPIPSKWLWEDAGNYYGAGAYGLSAFDNTFEIHLKTGIEGSPPVVTGIVPDEYRNELTNWLISSGTSDEGYVFAAPYSISGWIAGTVPVNTEDFILKASVSNPPLLIAKMMNNRLENAGIKITGEPATVRSEKVLPDSTIISVSVTDSPPLSAIIEVLNHESVNLFAEHLIKELGKYYRNDGSTSSGQAVIINFLNESGIDTLGMFIEDGSGLSPLNAINASELVRLLLYMRNSGKYFPEYFSSLPDAGKEGTLKYYFRDPVFDSRLHAKSGSMTRVRSYAGYFTTMSGRDMVFSIIVNNYTGPSRDVVAGIELIIKEMILDN
jgi:D-alanyl-D-alanine carboxypeptidase/D-alanyl-D-alanine-endopeptidase (penicillin-binding protein 4)